MALFRQLIKDEWIINMSHLKNSQVKKIKKIGKVNELAWFIGVLLGALGLCLSTKASFGLSMLSAPAYILHMKLHDIFSWYSHGTSEYIWQGMLLIIMCIIIRKFKMRYIFSFLTAVLFGWEVDAWKWVLGGDAAYSELWQRIIAFILGTLITAFAVALYFRTYMPLQMGELVVTEISDTYKLNCDKVKLVNDFIMLGVSIALTLILHHKLIGVGVGTIIVTFVNAPLIVMFGKLLDKIFDFSPMFPKLMKLCNPGKYAEYQASLKPAAETVSKEASDEGHKDAETDKKAEMQNSESR